MFVCRIILVLVIGLGFQSCVFAVEKVNLQDNLIGSTFKSLAKGLVLVINVDKFKKDTISKLNKLNPDKYKRKYALVYETIKELPSELRIKYEIIENMPKEQLIKSVESLDKKKIYTLINAIPNAIIAKEFKKYLFKKKQGVKDSSLVKDINEFWDKVLVKVNQPVLKK